LYVKLQRYDKMTTFIWPKMSEQIS